MRLHWLLVQRRMTYLQAILLLCLFLTCLCVEDPESLVSYSSQNEYFTVAVLEHALVGNLTGDAPEEILRMNMDYHERATALAKSKGADIILFPEYGLFPFESRNKMKSYLETIPDPKTGYWNPCLQEKLFSDRPMLRNLSCMAMKYEIMVVANTCDIQPCKLEENNYCPEDGTFHYNANTVFDRHGTIISRYRKEHLFLEDGMNLPQEPQDPVFYTDFGKFASFVCFDSLFKHVVEAAHMDGVDGVFLSIMWSDSMPFYNSIQYFQGWAIGNNVTSVVANMQSPKESAVGSGIFAGNTGALTHTYNPDGRSKLIVSKAPKTTHTTQLQSLDSSITVITSNGTELYNEDDVDFDNYLPQYCAKGLSEARRGDSVYSCTLENTQNYTFAKLEQASGQVSVCNNGMCCSLRYSAAIMNESFYLGVTNTTVNVLDRYFWCEEKCVVVRCEELDGKECSAFPTKSSTVFLELELKANFTMPYVYPSVMRTGMRTAPRSEWNYDVKKLGNHYEGNLSFTNSSPTNRLLIATLLGRCYDRDPPYTV